MAKVFKTVMITGHRPTGFSVDEIVWSRRELEKIVRQLKKHCSTEKGISGLALGADSWFADSLLRNEIPLHSFVPFPQQAESWSDFDKSRWNYFLKNSEKVVTIGDSHQNKFYHMRNDAMLRETKKDDGLVVALLKSSSTTGGTFSTVKKAEKIDLPVLIIDPENQTVNKSWE